MVELASSNGVRHLGGWASRPQRADGAELSDSLDLLVTVVIAVANLDDGTAVPRRLSRVTAEELLRMSVFLADIKSHNQVLIASDSLV